MNDDTKQARAARFEEKNEPCGELALGEDRRVVIERVRSFKWTTRITLVRGARRAGANLTADEARAVAQMLLDAASPPKRVDDASVHAASEKRAEPDCARASGRGIPRGRTAP